MELTFSLVDCTGTAESSVTPTHLKISMDWRCYKENGITTGFYISLFLDSMDQGRLEMVHEKLLMIGSGPQPESGDIDPVPPNLQASTNISAVYWNLVLDLVEAQGFGSFNVRVSGTMDTRWIIGELDLDPNAR